MTPAGPRLAVVALLLAAGCTSTLDHGLSTGAVDADGILAPAVSGIPGAPASGATVAAGTPATGGVGGPGAPSLSATPVPGTTGGAPTGGTSPAGEPDPVTGPGGPVAMGRGITDEAIEVGIVTLNVAGLQDAQGLNNGNNQVQAQAVVDALNAAGGIAGRQIQPVFEEFEASSTNWETDYQAICTSFTEDHGVFAVINASVAFARTFVPCLAQHDTPLVSSGGGRTDDRGMAELGPYLHHPGSMNLTRAGRSLVEGLADQGYFAPGSVVGLVRVDDDAYARVAEDVIAPALEQLGVSLVDAPIGAQTSLADSASQMPAVVLRFQQSGVDRVVFLDNATLGPLFTIQATTQGYRPLYGFTTLSNPVLIQQNVPAQALEGALAVGWQPTYDVFEADDPDPNGAALWCEQLMAQAGEGDVSRTGQWAQRMYCDELTYLKAALEAAPELTVAGLAAGASGLATSYTSPLTFRTSFAPGRTDGSAAVRHLRYVTECSCFRYVTGDVAIP